MADKGEIILYQTDDGLAQIQLKALDGTVWLTQGEIADLFQTTPQNITQHIKAIYEDNELVEESTCKDFLQVQIEGGREIERRFKHYHLDMILAVGYRIRSPRGVQFRRWATTILHDYLVKGFAMNDEKMKDPIGFDYFDELLERIRDIRASEKRFYQQVKDVYTTATDYDGNSEDARLFFKTVQNKMLFAVTGKTAAELIVERADATEPNMGLQSFKGSVVRKGDVATAKNYLLDDEISELNRITTMYLDHAEDMARRRKQMTMQDWQDKLDAFMEFNERGVLQNAGKVKAKKAKQISHEQYAEFDTARKDAALLEAETEYIEDLKVIEEEAKSLQKQLKKDTSDGG